MLAQLLLFSIRGDKIYINEFMKPGKINADSSLTIEKIFLINKGDE